MATMIENIIRDVERFHSDDLIITSGIAVKALINDNNIIETSDYLVAFDKDKKVRSYYLLTDLK